MEQQLRPGRTRFLLTVPFSFLQALSFKSLTESSREFVRSRGCL